MSPVVETPVEKVKRGMTVVTPKGVRYKVARVDRYGEQFVVRHSAGSFVPMVAGDPVRVEAVAEV